MGKSWGGYEKYKSCYLALFFSLYLSNPLSKKDNSSKSIKQLLINFHVVSGNNQIIEQTDTNGTQK